MPGSEAFLKFIAIILPRYASKMSGWVASWKAQVHIIFRACLQHARLGDFGELKAIALPEDASEMTGREAFGNSRP